MREELPVAVIGAGPVGLAAAAHLIERDVPVRIFEAGPNPGENIRDWGHVRLFSIWDQCVDEAAVSLLMKNGWKKPDGNALPTGKDLVELYLRPACQDAGNFARPRDQCAGDAGFARGHGSDEQ